MNKHKSITFDKAAQDALPQHIKDLMQSQRNEAMKRRSPEHLSTLLSQFKDGEHRFNNEAVFNHCMNLLLRGAEPLQVMEKLFDIIKSQSEMISQEVLQKNSQRLERPIILHNHTPGEWIMDPESIDHVICGDKVIGLFKRTDDAKLCTIAPRLIQIAEMYFDRMKALKEENTMIFHFTLETLNKLKQ